MSDKDVENLIIRANKKINSFNLFGIFKNDNYKKAAELYKKAGNIYKIRMEWNKCTECFIKVSELYNYIKDNESDEFLLMAARTASKYDVKYSLILYDNYLNCVYIDNKIARLYGEMAEMCNNNELLDEAISYYKKAYEYSDIEGSKYSTIKYLTALCSVYIKSNRYLEAGDNFLKLEKYNNLYARKYILISILCYLNHDIELAKEKLNENKDNMENRDIDIINTCIDIYDNKILFLKDINYDYLSIRLGNNIKLLNNIKERLKKNNNNTDTNDDNLL